MPGVARIAPMPEIAHETWVQIARTVSPGSRLLAVRPLAGGVSASVTALDVEQPGGGVLTVVVRRHGDVDFALKPDVAATEFQLLHRLSGAGLPVPQPLHLEPSSDLLGRPFLVTSLMPGQTWQGSHLPAGMVDQMATLLAQIHTIPAGDAAVAPLPAMSETVSGRLAARPASGEFAAGELLLRSTLEAAWPPVSRNAPVLLHGDFWPGNLLWEDERLTAVVDWEDAQQGDPLGDLAQTRLELLWAYGKKALEAFSDVYLTRNPIDTTALPYWDIWAALRPIQVFAGWAENEAAARRLQARHTWFMRQALDALGIEHLLPDTQPDQLS